MFQLTATLLDGSTQQATRVTELPMAEVVRLRADTDLGFVTLVLNHDAGESAHAFTRVAMSSAAEPLRVPVVEVRRAGTWTCRLYLHPVEGPLLSTQDLYF